MIKNIQVILAITFALISTMATAQDFAYFEKYKNENSKIITSKRPVKAVFFGDSITEFWKVNDADFFNKNNFENRGISGQTTVQMLIRFRDDVINLKPKTVFILAGTNDIAENMGQISLENVFGNIVSMVELAKFNKIKPVIFSVLPARKFSWNPKLEPAQKIVDLNKMLKDYCKKNLVDFVDFHSEMKTEENAMNLLYTDDEVHPNLAGYRKMEEVFGVFRWEIGVLAHFNSYVLPQSDKENKKINVYSRRFGGFGRFFLLLKNLSH